MLGESIISLFFEPVLKRASIWVRRHIFRTFGIAFSSIGLLVLGLLNPWFGSHKAKYFVIEYMIGGSDDIEYILKRGSSDSNTSASWIAGAGRAGLYSATDKAIVDQWSQVFNGNNYTVLNSRDKRFAAILAARDRAELHQPPFQPIGTQAVASSPSCQRTRPPTGQVYLRADSYLATLLHSGDAIKLLRKDGLGVPVVAIVNKVPDMPKDTDLYLNRVQMVDFLASTTKLIGVRVVGTDEHPNQNDEDRYQSDVKISCSRG